MKILNLFFDAYDSLRNLFTRNSASKSERSGFLASVIPAVILLLLIITLALGFYWDTEPDSFDPLENASRLASERNEEMTTGYITTATLIKTAETMLDKRGGYLSNDMLPPGLLMDNIPNWEFGVLTQVRDLTLALRNDITRSQSQSIEDKDINTAENKFRIDSDSWMLPPAESEYRSAIKALYRYLGRLADSNTKDVQFYARADNLGEWLGLISKRLGSLSQRLSASVGQARLNTDLAGDPDALQSTPADKMLEVKTPWLLIDDIFYEARGSAWALSHLLKAAEVDFQDILKKKNALVSLQQIVRELDATQETVWSPMILNGSGFGTFANHSLVMANYISRANAAVIDLRRLLKNG
ncbi:FIG014328: hypothetical protein [hydrothermal vent metagenome]|uniref:DUF2333 domain-containing protein n=1 Tax=hydrothermal vent metagenome TaxID=652676 RepID=A0A3B0WXU3_9ZZZZ